MRIISAGIALALIVVAIQSGSWIKTLSTKVADRIHTPAAASDPHPATFTLTFVSGGSLHCRLAGTAYTCTPVPEVPGPAREKK
jgi:hypothetical protein